MKKNKAWIVWVIVFGIGILIAVSLLLSYDFFHLTEATDIYKAACDAFFVPGILMLSFGLLGVISGEGLFDIMGYGTKSLLVLFSPLKKPEKMERYYDYKKRKAELRKKPRSAQLFIAGAVFMAAAIVCLMMYAAAGGLN